MVSELPHMVSSSSLGLDPVLAEVQTKFQQFQSDCGAWSAELHRRQVALEAQVALASEDPAPGPFWRGMGWPLSTMVSSNYLVKFKLWSNICPIYMGNR